MIRRGLAALFALLAGAASAQTLSPFAAPQPGPNTSRPPQVQTVPPLAPIQSQSLQPGTPAPGLPGVIGPGVIGPGVGASGAGTPMPAPSSPPPAATAAAGTPLSADWQPRATAELQALDKVTARVTTLTVKPGDTLRFGSLNIAIRGCVVRPPDQPADAAAFLDITDSRPGGAAFHGWMLAAEPAIGVFEHPVYDIRLTACR